MISRIVQRGIYIQPLRIVSVSEKRETQSPCRPGMLPRKAGRNAYSSFTFESNIPEYANCTTSDVD